MLFGRSLNLLNYFVSVIERTKRKKTHSSSSIPKMVFVYHLLGQTLHNRGFYRLQPRLRVKYYFRLSCKNFTVLFALTAGKYNQFFMALFKFILRLNVQVKRNHCQVCQTFPNEKSRTVGPKPVLSPKIEL